MHSFNYLNNFKATLFINEMTNLGMEGMHIGESIKTAMFNFATTQQLVLAS